jgi:triacylglycerol esterase/lipase EstA (alpha/beta hydrolase family)
LIALAVLVELLAELALYAAAVRWLAQAHGVPLWASAVLAFALFLGLRAALLALLYVRAGLGAGLFRLLPGELRALLDIYTLGLLAHRWLAPRDPARIAPGVLPVVFVHGILCNAGVWHRMLAALERQGMTNLFTLSLAPPLASMDRFARQLAARVEEACRAAGTERAIIVAHSMGGLVARCWIARLGGAARAERLVTLGSPHHGSLLARGFPARWAGEMLCGCEWLEQLAADGSRARGVPVTSIYSRADEFVAPQESSRLEGARNVALERLGHLELLRSEEVRRLVLAEIASARGARLS